MNKKVPLFVASLAAITAVNAVAHRERDRPFSPLLPGDVFRKDLRALEGRTPRRGECELAFVIHPRCSACRNLTRDLVDRELADLPLWISLADSAETALYVFGERLPRARVRLLEEGRTDISMLALGIPVIPARIELRDDGIVGHVVSPYSFDAEAPSTLACVVARSSVP
jgi:hypothetical protein